MSKISKWFTALLAIFMITAGITTLTTTSASAVTGCSGSVQDKIRTWTNDVTYWNPRYGYQHKVRLYAGVTYQHCPGGTAVDKVRPRKVDYCWTFLSEPGYGGEEHYAFDGVDFDPVFFDDAGRMSNPAVKFVYDNEKVQNCETQTIATDNITWLWMNADPKWTLRYKVKLYYQDDKEGYFATHHGNYKPFKPADDTVVRSWYQ